MLKQKNNKIFPEPSIFESSNLKLSSFNLPYNKKS